MKIAAEHAPTTQRRRAVEGGGRSTAMDDSGTSETCWRFFAATIAQIPRPSD
ncbi:MAG TPA: hypothetical protein VJR47_18540 [Stellaceae bacterium]|nr:hypothetical protein [Stellaceae bacterium]